MRRCLLIIGLLAPLFMSAHEAAAEMDSIWQEAELNEVVVTGTRTRKTLKEVPVQTRLITSTDLRRADATDIQDLLQTELPGIEFSYAMNQQVNMNLAGFAGQSVLILVDGERLAGETMDNVDFSRLTMSGAARIEIVKGAASALYGSNAAGGVINIITKAPAKPWSLNLNARAGRHNEWRYGGTFMLKGKHITNTLDFSAFTISGYTVCVDAADECDFRRVPGYKTYNIKDRITYSPLDNLTFSARAGYYFKERYYNVDTPDRYRDFSAGLTGKYRINEHGDLEVAYSFDQYDKSDYLRDQRLDVRDYRNVLHALRAVFNHQFNSRWLLTTGADFTYDYLDTYQFAPGEDKRQNTFDVFAQGDWTINDRWEVVGALRYDYYSDSKDSRLTTKINGRYRWDELTLRAAYAQGFRAPTLKERYMNFDMAGIFDIHGNPDLKPEISHNLYLSAEYAWNKYIFTLGGSYTFVDNKISTSAIRYGVNGQPYIDYINVDKLRVAGIDATVQGEWNHGISAKLSYAFTHEQTVGGSVTQYCPARPHSLNAQVSWYRAWSRKYNTNVTLSGRFLSQVSYDSMYMYEPFETKRVVNPAYCMLKLQLNQTILSGIRVNITLDNLLNYKPKIYSYNSPITDGINLLVGLSLDLDKLF